MSAAAEALLRELLRTVADKHYHQPHEVQIKEMSSGGANYSSALFLITMTAEDKEPLHLFAKVAILGDKMRELMDATKMFAIEGFFFNDLIRTYEDMQDRHGLAGEDRLAVPKFYGCNPNVGEETVVLENLTARGYESCDRFRCLDYALASSAIEELAKLHALSFAYRKEKPDEFNKVKDYLWYTRPDVDADGYFAEMTAQAVRLLDEEPGGRVQRFMTSENVAKMYQRFNRPFGVPVIIHGDYRPSNLFFKRKSSRVQTIPVDFQTMRVGSGAMDLIYFLFLSSDAAFRAQHFTKLVELYYERLKGAMKKLAVDAEEVYPRKEFDREVKEVLPYAVFLAVAMLPLYLVEEKDAPTVDGDSDINNFIVAPGDLYPERLRGIIHDCVRLGAI